MSLDVDQIYLGNCLEVMQEITADSIDAIITDPPYGMTQNRWDVAIPFDEMWEAFGRVVKDRSPMALFGIPPFSSQTIVSNPKQYRYSWVWDKRSPVGFLNANRAPLRRYEVISVFSRRAPAYYPQMTSGKPYVKGRRDAGENYGSYESSPTVNCGLRYPVDILEDYSNAMRGGNHPTEKPVPLMEYLVKTYTQPGDVVLDPFLGSGTTAIACINTGRRYIGIEQDEEYYEISEARIREAQAQQRLFPPGVLG